MSHRSRAFGWIGVAALLFIVLFWRLGDATFWDPDEAHYAETTRELIRTGDWWAPAYNEQTFFDKPILFHQLQAVTMLAFSDPELGARAVPALAALALVLITAWVGTALISSDTGVLGGLLVAASPGLFALARYAILDTLFTAFLFGGVSLAAVAALRNRPRLQYPGYLLIGLATLTKGPLAIALCGVSMIGAAVLSSTLRQQLLRLRWITGLAIAIAVAAPWFVYMYLRFGQPFVDGYFLDENVRLFGVNRFPGQPGPAFYFQIVAAGLLPWTAILLGRLVDDVRVRAAGRRVDEVEVLLWIWAAAIIGFFTLSRFKLDHYVFPALPALALIIARAWADVRANRTDPRHTGTRLGVLVTGPLLILMGAAAAYLLIVRLDLPALALAAPAAMIVAGAAMIPRATGRRPQVRIPVLALGAVAVTYAVVVGVVIPRLETRKVMPDLGRWIAARAEPEDRVAIYRLNNAFRFYVDRHVTVLNTPEEALRFIEHEKPFFFVMPETLYRELAGHAQRLRVVYSRDGVTTTSGRALWRGRTDWTRFVVVTRSDNATPRDALRARDAS